LSGNCVEEGKMSTSIEKTGDGPQNPGTGKVWLFARWIEVFLGLTFILSAVLKAVDIAGFAVQVSYFGIVREPMLVRFVAFSTVLVETAIGIALLVGWKLQEWALRAVFALLVGFTVLILYAWAFKGLEDCGCFGSFVKLTPAMSVLKNLVMMAFVAVAWIGYRKARIESVVHTPEPRYVWFVRAISAAACCLLVLASLAYGYLQQENGSIPRTITSQPYDKDRPFAQFRFEHEGFDWDLGVGEYFVALLSDTCEHCAAAGEEMNEMLMSLPGMPPIVALVLGTENSLQQFREHVDPQYPTILIEPLRFGQLLDDAVAPPRFFYVRDGKGLRHWDEELPEETELRELMAESRATAR